MTRELFHIDIPLAVTPPGKGRARVYSRNEITRAVTPRRTVQFEELIRSYAGAQGVVRPIEQGIPIWLTLKFTCRIPTSFSQAKRFAAIAGDIRPVTRPDIDNQIKMVMDALNKVAWYDDSQVVDIHAVKVYGITPWLAITAETTETTERKYLPTSSNPIWPGTGIDRGYPPRGEVK